MPTKAQRSAISREEEAIVVPIANHPEFAPHRTPVGREERAKMALSIMSARGDRLVELRDIMRATGML
jgi:hypothetical protein